MWNSASFAANFYILCLQRCSNIRKKTSTVHFRHLHFWLDTFTFGALFDTFTFGTCTFGSTLSLLEHFSTLSLSALALLARHFHFSTLSLFKPQIFWHSLTLFKLSHFQPHQEKDKHFQFQHLHFWFNTLPFEIENLLALSNPFEI